jgi:hypothetical protein
MDNAKQFAYFPVAVLKSVPSFSRRHDQREVQDRAGDADRASGILFNVKPNGDWLAIRYNDTETQRCAVGIPQRSRRASRRTGRQVDARSRRVARAQDDGRRRRLQGLHGCEMALEYTLGSEPRPGRNGAAPNRGSLPGE